MPCQKCMTFVSDVLQQPPHPSSEHAPLFKKKRLIGCLETITYLLTKLIEGDRPDLYNWLNIMEMMNCAVLNQAQSRNYRLYQIWINRKSDLDEIIILLVENYILSNTKNRTTYEEWFAEKAIFLVQSLRQIHTEHSGGLFIKVKTAGDDTNGLYD